MEIEKAVNNSLGSVYNFVSNVVHLFLESKSVDTAGRHYDKNSILFPCGVIHLPHMHMGEKGVVCWSVYKETDVAKCSVSNGADDTTDYLKRYCYAI